MRDNVKEKQRLEQAIKQNLQKTQSIINSIDSALVILENGAIVNTNRRFLSLANCINIEEFNAKLGRIDSIFVPARGYIVRFDNQELIAYLKEKGALKVVVRDKDGMVIMQATINTISENSELIMLTDVTTIEKDLLNSKQKFLINPFTGLPNKIALMEKVLPKYSTTLVLFSIVDYQHVIKWIGHQKAIESERFAAETLKSTLESKKLPVLFLSNFDKNSFVILTNKNDAKQMETIISNLEPIFRYSKEVEGALFDSMTLKLCSKTVTIEKDTHIDIAMQIINRSFDDMLL